MNWGLLGGALIAGFVIALISVSLSIQLANRFDILDYPDSDRKVQIRPIPKLGGLAVGIAFTLTTGIALIVLDIPGELQLASSAIIPAVFAGFVGYLDDRRHLNPYLRLVFQGVTGVLVWWLGSQVDVFGFTWLNAALVVIFVMALINGLNLLDNSDGLAGSTVIVSALGASVIAVISGQELVSVLGFALVGVALGFLRYNWFPARVYLGDSGAYFLGTLLASLLVGLRPTGVSPIVGVALALLLAALPILDTTYVVARRLKVGIHPFTAGRDHLAHRLQDKGRTVAGSVLTLQAGLFVTTAVAIGLAAAQVS